MTAHQANQLSARGASALTMLLAGLFVASPEAALAYVGPGAGLTAIGTIFALMGAVVLALVGFVWYPVKRLLKRRTAEVPVSQPERAPK